MTVSLHGHRRIHLVGIGGIGMSALARFLLARGYEVSGSDRSWNDQMNALQELGAQLTEGHAAASIGDADLVVVTSAAAPDNPEIVAARNADVQVVKRAELLGAIASAGRCVAIAGTHGKTTTSALIGHILIEAGLDPTILIGGISLNLGSNARIGAGEWVVVEADEYDRSFLHLRPEIAVLTSVEADHLDIYGTEENVRAAYRTFAEQVMGTLVACCDDPYMSEITSGLPSRVVTYGTHRGDWSVVSENEPGTSVDTFTVEHNGTKEGLSTHLAGAHNRLNVLAAYIVAQSCGVHPGPARKAIGRFEGVERRFQEIGEAQTVLVMDDYAHHPTEIRTNLAALKARYRRPVRVVFQPHTYSRTKSFLDDFATSFSEADAVYLMDVYAARETDTLGVSGEVLAEKTSAHHPRVTYRGTERDMLDQLQHDVEPFDIVVTMGAGDVNKLGPNLLDRLRES